MDKNHEGYYDPTASKAIRRISRKRKEVIKSDTLTYKLSDVPGFRIARRMILR